MPYLQIDYNLINNHLDNTNKELGATELVQELKIGVNNKLDKLFYANQQLVKKLMDSNTKDKSVNSIELIDGKSDLIVNQYEGGFKLWEGLYDIIEYLSQSNILDNYSNQLNVNVLELGCGSGLASIYVSKKLSKSNLYLQDFNEEVIKYFSGVNVKLNSSESDISRFNYIFGDWSLIADDINGSGLKFDLILSSETLYNCDNYEKFVEVIKTGLSNTGSAYIATKSHYFGVGGGTYSFMDYIQSDKQLECDICHEIEAPLIRHILKINFKKCKDSDFGGGLNFSSTVLKINEENQ